MEKIVECVPNFSEGRDMTVIKQITDEIEKVPGTRLLDVDPGKDTNRTVVTFAGSPDAAAEGAFQAIKKAAELIDMSRHTGTHARMGATDVCPFVPVSGVTMEDCAEIARKVAKRVGEELGIPVYLYAHAASREDRRRLPDIREGEYEALQEKFKREDFKPDFGPAAFIPRTGATAVGARDFLIAYNVNINSRDVKIAKKIANRVREKGRMVRNKKTGELEQQPGTLKALQGMGWYIEEYSMAQITVNIMDYKATPIHRVFEECEKFAAQFGARVTGSELVGMIPLDAMLEAGRNFLRKQGGSTGVHEEELIRIAVQSMGMNEISEFKNEDRIIEYKFRKKGRLASMDFYRFGNELASDSPAPGGGSVAALCGMLSSGLSSMVGNLTYSKKEYQDVREEMIGVSEKAQQLKVFFTQAVDSDTEAFDKVMAAMGLPKGTPEEKQQRDAAVLAATKEATLVPFSVMENALEAARLARIVAEKGNRNSLSDAGVAGLAAETAAEGALYNVMINLDGFGDEEFKSELIAKSMDIIHRVKQTCSEIRKIMDSGLKIPNENG